MSANLPLLNRLVLTACLLTLTVSSAQGQVRSGAEVKSEVEHYVLPEVSPQALRAADERRVLNDDVPHYAVAHRVDLSPWDEDRWQLVDGRAHWKARLTSPGALSLNLAFGRYVMPAGGRLVVRSVDGTQRLRAFTDVDNDVHGQLWTPPVLSDDLWLELSLPVDALGELELELSLVHHGYAGFGAPAPKSGECHVDIACSEAAGWGDVARSVAVLSIEGVRFCTGFLVNNTALDGRPFFVTAEHCGVDRHNAASVVVMWKHERPTCGFEPASTADWSFQTGAIWRASHRSSDTTLIELDDPPPADASVFYAGWDRSEAAPEQTVTIHHPNTDVKRISFDFDPASISSHLGRHDNPRGQHFRVDGWDMGSTEGGSSGAPLLNGDKRVVGQLHGGYAACGNVQPDWFGRFSSAWKGRGRLGSRLSDWLDPIGDRPMVLDGLDGVDAGR